jgi:hypothetical protein
MHTPGRHSGRRVDAARLDASTLGRRRVASYWGWWRGTFAVRLGALLKEALGADDEVDDRVGDELDVFLQGEAQNQVPTGRASLANDGRGKASRAQGMSAHRTMAAVLGWKYTCRWSLKAGLDPLEPEFAELVGRGWLFSARHGSSGPLALVL